LKLLTTEWVLLLQATSSSNKINDVESVAVTEISIFPPYSKAIHPQRSNASYRPSFHQGIQKAFVEIIGCLSAPY
jgi:hypothetical protein